MINKITCGDCLDLLPKIPDKSIDFILCDLPYGMTAPEWDKNIDITKLWQEYRRVLKKTGTVALFASQPFTTQLIASNFDNFRYCWYWLKNQGTNFFHAKHMPIRKIEEICIFYKGIYNPQITDGHIPTSPAKGCSNGKAYFGKNKRDYAGGKTTRYPTNVLEYPCVSNYKRIHSAEKPVILCEFIIRSYTLEGQTVLDTCIGSGTTAVACKETGRNFIGMEINPDFCEMANKRIGQ